MTGLRKMLLIATVWGALQHPQLLDSSPQPSETLTVAPTEVSLLFDRPLNPDETWVGVRSSTGETLDNQDSSIDPTNPNRVSVTLPVLPPGAYVVEYTAVSRDDAATIIGSFGFVIVSPPPALTLLSPSNGEVLADGAALIEVTVDGFDLSEEANGIRLYVDGEVEAEVNDLTYSLRGLAPGVHQIQVVLARAGEDLGETMATVYVAVPQPDPEAEGRLVAMMAEPDPGLQLTPLQIALVTALAAAIFVGGVWLGRT